MSRAPYSVIETSLPRDECVRRLLDAVDEAPTSMFSAAPPFRGRDFAGTISDDMVRVYWRGSNLGAFRPILMGTLVASGSTTQLHYRIGFATYTSYLMAVSFGFIALVLAGLLLASLAADTGSATPGNLNDAIVTVSVIAAGAASMLLFAMWKHPREQSHLRRSVREIISGVERRDAA